MTFKKIYGLILGVVAVGLASCSSDLNNEGNTPINPTKTAKRSLTLSANNATTRSYISLQDGNQWRKGDRFIVYNLTSPAGTDELVAKGDGANTLLEGNVTCADNNEIAVFFPYQNSAGVGNQHKVDISLNMSNLSENGQVVNRAQDGKLENLKYFDFSYGTTRVRTTPGSNNVTGNVQMHKQYAVLRLKFKADGQELKNLKKLTISNVFTSGRFDMSTGQLTEKQKGDITITPSAPLDSFVVAVFPEEHFQPTFTVVGSDNKTYRFSVGVDLPIANADYAPYVVAVKEITPYIEIDGVKWGKYNLQYTPNSKTVGWKDGYHLAKNPWDYFYTESSPMNLEPNVIKIPSSNADNAEFDHFRWGDISKAHSFAYDDKDHYDTSVENIEKKNSNNEYGDIAYYASKGDWRLPNVAEFESLMRNTTEYIGYYPSEAGDVLGVLFVPDGVAHGKIIGKNGQVVSSSNVNGNISGFSGKNYQTSTIVRKFTAEEISKGIFFPATGTFTNYSSGPTNLNNAGRMGYYWTADCFNATQAKSFTFQFAANGRVMFATVGNSRADDIFPPKNNMYSIRPIYIGQ
jgi:putative lipoprotein